MDKSKSEIKTIKTKSKGMGGLDIDTEIKPGKNGKRPNHNQSKLQITRTIDPRPSRRGYKLHVWPKEHLATVIAARHDFNCSRGELLRLLNINRPDIGRFYKEYTGREMNSNSPWQRTDKAIRQCELKNYSHLMSAAHEQIKKWLTDDILN